MLLELFPSDASTLRHIKVSEESERLDVIEITILQLEKLFEFKFIESATAEREREVRGREREREGERGEVRESGEVRGERERERQRDRESGEVREGER
jgi:hypothetical protein